jgi:endonuclease YncB( thermonuclease family)
MKLVISLMSLWFTAATPALAPLTGQVVAVHDGDTLMVKSGPSLYKVRLSDVDAPELRQVFGKQARNFTKNLALGRRVQVNVTLIDKHDRRIGEVIIEDGRVLNEELVHAGLAWYYRVNLWVEPEPIPPWEYRRESHIPDAPTTAEQVDYDRIFHYGIVGHRRTKTIRWPACKKYRLSRPQQALIFHSLQQAHQMGFKSAKDCPR